jgi:hypothetical protein
LANIINGTDTGSGGLITTGDSSDELQLQTAEVARVTLTNTAVVVNESGADVDFRVEGDTEANLLFVDASAEAIGIGTNSVTGFGTAYRVVEIVGPSGNGAAVRLRGGGDAAASEDAIIYKVNGSSGGLVLRNYANARIVFMANNANVVEFQTGGAVTLKGATDTANGTGITFPATQNASSDSNTLDDYEEGTTTVTFTPSTSGTITLNASYQTVAYTKVGRLVTITGELFVSSVSTPVGTSVSIGNLPFAAGGALTALSSGFGILDLGAGSVVGARVNTTANTIDLRVDASTIGANYNIVVGFSYMT